MQVTVAAHADGEQSLQGVAVARVHVGQVASNLASLALLAEPQALKRRGDLFEEEGDDLRQEGILVGVVVIEGRARDHHP